MLSHPMRGHVEILSVKYTLDNHQGVKPEMYLCHAHAVQHKQLCLEGGNLHQCMTLCYPGPPALCCLLQPPAYAPPLVMAARTSHAQCQGLWLEGPHGECGNEAWLNQALSRSIIQWMQQFNISRY